MPYTAVIDAMTDSGMCCSNEVRCETVIPTKEATHARHGCTTAARRVRKKIFWCGAPEIESRK
jgi:hypothetical protein